ncbi:zinc finger-containing ubiquitin peptidase 1-like isoform X2 [Daktulosphaira vitifoliae]|nr:zinc finger-containing ubiquitin peptidase 1-like isoform X2 [Daktulosphaira vitifoliae]
MSSRPKTVCEICGESFLTENKLSNHITERHVHSSTNPPHSVCSSSKRRKLDDSDMRCPLCDYVDLDADRLQQHVNRMHFDPGSPRRPGTVDFPCPICPLAFDQCDHLETHINEEHHDIVSPQLDSDSQRIPLLENINEGCVICGMKNFDSLRDLDAHIEQHYRGSTPPTDHLPDQDQLLAKQLEKQERERMKQKEKEDFQKLQAAYGMDNKGNYNQQTMANLQAAVSSGEMSVYDYYEKMYEIKIAESKGLDTGASATRDLIEYIRHFSMASPNVNEVHLASPTDHYRSTYGDKGWGCGYRNMQMLMSSMLLQLDYNEHISRVWEVEKGPLPRSWMPSISRLQQHLEKSWSMGIDEPGKEQLGGTVYNTKKWIGATEVVTMLTALRIKSQIVDFYKPTGPKNTHPEMFRWLYKHFNDRSKKYIPPVYIQHDGHSRTVVGVEKLSDGTILLLLLDPSNHYDKLRTESGMNTMAHIRKSLHTLKSKQYQLVTVRGIMTNDTDFE